MNVIFTVISECEGVTTVAMLWRGKVINVFAAPSELVVRLFE